MGAHDRAGGEVAGGGPRVAAGAPPVQAREDVGAPVVVAGERVQLLLEHAVELALPQPAGVVLGRGPRVA